MFCGKPGCEIPVFMVDTSVPEEKKIRYSLHYHDKRKHYEVLEHFSEPSFSEPVVLGRYTEQQMSDLIGLIIKSKNA